MGVDVVQRAGPTVGGKAGRAAPAYGWSLNVDALPPPLERSEPLGRRRETSSAPTPGL
jgi:hypothetical protein